MSFFACIFIVTIYFMYHGLKEIQNSIHRSQWEKDNYKRGMVKENLSYKPSEYEKELNRNLSEEDKKTREALGGDCWFKTWNGMWKYVDKEDR